VPLYLYFYSIFWHSDYPCLFFFGYPEQDSLMHEVRSITDSHSRYTFYINLWYLLLDTPCFFCFFAYDLLLLIYWCIPYDLFLHYTWFIAVIFMYYCFILHDLSLFCLCIRLISILAYPELTYYWLTVNNDSCYVKQDRGLLRDNSDLRAFTRLGRERIPLWNGKNVSVVCTFNVFDDDNLSNICDSWKDEL